MLSKIRQIWKDKGFEIVLYTCIAFFIIFGLYNIICLKKGTFSKNINYITLIPPSKNNKKSTDNYDNTNNFNNNFNNNFQKKYSKGETECRRVLENIFNKPFNSERPDFLKNTVTGGKFNLELDCYNQELRLAVEYNGVQHYKFVSFFHRNNDHFMTQKYRDDMKRRICKENNINLIEVPYTVKIEDIKDFIINKCKILRYIK